MELPAVTVLASKNVNAGAAGAWVVLAAEQQGGGMWMRCDWIEGSGVFQSEGSMSEPDCTENSD